MIEAETLDIQNFCNCDIILQKKKNILKSEQNTQKL